MGRRQPRYQTLYALGLTGKAADVRRPRDPNHHMVRRLRAGREKLRIVQRAVWQVVEGRDAYWQPRGKLAGWKIMLCRMQPGEWYGLTDIRALMPDTPSGSIHAWVIQRLFPAGMLERAPNAEFDPSRPDRRQSACRYLYRIGAKALESRAEWLSVLSEYEDSGDG